MHVYGPFLLLLEADQLAVLTMHVVLTHLLGSSGVNMYPSEAGQAKLTDIAIVLGKVWSTACYVDACSRTDSKAEREHNSCNTLPCLAVT